MNFLYVFLACLLLLAERSEASFEHGHGFGEYGHVPMVAAASPLYYAHFPAFHSYSGLGYGGFFPYKNRKAARRNRHSHRKH
ncbi:hypothetical protein Y032_0096g2895 [Ancylostoma ceylanicum]|uniref:Uncharacterized protein n=1 Tax=Ancylostoma ceylanicum TaxID=53326 RepID=A0A016TJZ2_9BILA|nr:hypothetical protein Y032_0096g2895 [Ancylostoma ceylanicum]